MTGPGYGVNITALRTYSKNLDYYQGEADSFGRLVDQADVSNESWGLIGLAVKQQYTTKLGELQELLHAMREGVDSMSSKITNAANIYQGLEDDAVLTFGQYEANIDGPRG